MSFTLRECNNNIVCVCVIYVQVVLQTRSVRICACRVQGEYMIIVFAVTTSFYRTLLYPVFGNSSSYYSVVSERNVRRLSLLVVCEINTRTAMIIISRNHEHYVRSTYDSDYRPTTSIYIRCEHDFCKFVIV